MKGIVLTSEPGESLSSAMAGYREELKKGFEEGYNHMILNVHYTYQEGVLAILRREYPEYEFEPWEATKIWVWGGFDEELSFAIDEVKALENFPTREPSLIVRQKYIHDVCYELGPRFPTKKFEVRPSLDDGKLQIFITDRQ